MVIQAGEQAGLTTIEKILLNLLTFLSTISHSHSYSIQFPFHLQGDPSAQTSGVLANFFNSLLSNKKQPGSRSGSTVRAAATVELDRLQNKS